MSSKSPPKKNEKFFRVSEELKAIKEAQDEINKTQKLWASRGPVNRALSKCTAYEKLCTVPLCAGVK